MELSPLTGAQSAFPSLTVTSHTPLWGKPGTSYPQAKGQFEKCRTRALLLALGACAWICFVQGFRCSPQSTCLAVLCGRGGKEHCPSQQHLGQEGMQCPPPPPTPGRLPGWAWSTTAHAGRIHHCLYSGETVNNREGSAVHPTQQKNSPTSSAFFFFVFATLLDPYQGLNPVPPALVVRGLNHCPAGEVLSLALNTSQGYQEAGQGRSEPSQPFFVNQPGSTGREDEVLSHDACILIFGLYPVQEPGPHSLSPCPRPGSQEPSGGRVSMEPVLGPQAVPQLGHQQAETALGL